MQITRGTLLAKLNEASVGTASKPTIEQSNCFVFRDGEILTFNDSIMVRTESPLDFDAVVNATDFLGILAKLPDEELEVALQGGEVVVQAGRRSMGIASVATVALPVELVPKPAGAWSRLPDGILGVLLLASRTCGNDDAQYLTTCVHATPGMAEACDNFRFFRMEMATGFPAEALLPAAAIAALEGLDLKAVQFAPGWCHFQNESGAQISLRCSDEKYFDRVEQLLVMSKPEQVLLPANLGEILERAEVFSTGAYDATVRLKFNGEDLTIMARKDGGWYRERKRVAYSGRPLDFEVNPKFLAEILTHTREVLVDEQRMKISYNNISFVVCLAAKGTEA